jgi:hypothetical protein
MSSTHLMRTLLGATFSVALCMSAVSAYAQSRGGGSSAGTVGSRGASALGASTAASGTSGAATGSSSSGTAGTSGTGVRAGVSTSTPSQALTPSSGPSNNQPRQELPQIAQPSPQLPTQFATGGSSGVNTGLAAGTPLSPSESKPSSPGGGGKSLEACMGFWDAATHMSKNEWRATCLRTMKNF